MRTAGTTEIETVSGNLVELLSPDLEDISLWDMVTSLSRTCRFNGNTKFHYSNAQHSCLVASLLSKSDKVHGLLHDAAEYLTGDITQPVKRALKLVSPDFPRAWAYLERAAERAIYEKAGVPLPNEWQRETVKYADLVALAIEKRDILASPNNWNLPHRVPDDQATIVPLDAEAARSAFLDALESCGVTISVPMGRHAVEGWVPLSDLAG